MRIKQEIDLERLHANRLAAIEASSGPIVAIPAHYPAGYHVKPHHHTRAQLLYARTGVVMVTSVVGRWMVPPEHALWIPPDIQHSVEMLAGVNMLSIYVQPGAVPDLPDEIRVVALDDLTRALIVEAVALPFDSEPDHRARLVTALLLDGIPRLPEAPLGLPFPSEPRLAALCRRFIDKPSPHLVIDDWADELAMSRRTFTRAFRRETGLSLSTWRQQACLFTALPRLADGEAVTSVALDLGYESVAAFTTMFKRMLGAPPRGYFEGN
ncbi:MAG: helix-turn-helix transcriptional regulator [Devosia nanyangense]|nr:helix-turn-helix transcriptional regulator [Devosia nanyangense]